MSREILRSGLRYVKHTGEREDTADVDVDDDAEEDDDSGGGEGEGSQGVDLRETYGETGKRIL